MNIEEMVSFSVTFMVSVYHFCYQNKIFAHRLNTDYV